MFFFVVQELHLLFQLGSDVCVVSLLVAAFYPCALSHHTAEIRKQTEMTVLSQDSACQTKGLLGLSKPEHAAGFQHLSWFSPTKLASLESLAITPTCDTAIQIFHGLTSK